MIETRDSGLLVNVTKYLVMEVVDNIEAEHASCDDMKSGYEARFCSDDVLYIITAQPSTNSRLKFMGWSYACKRHLTKLVLEFAVRMAEKHLDIEYDEWNDEQVELENQIENHLPLTSE